MLYVVTGPPAAGKSTYCREHAQHGDIVIDHDALAVALAGGRDPDSHDHPKTVKTVTKAARRAAIDKAITLAHECDVYLIHSTPSAALLERYQAAGAEIITIDPGIDVVLGRAKLERPWWMQGAIKRWYEQQSGAEPVAHRPKARAAKPKRTTAQRGYGQEHRKQREALVPLVQSGKATCWRCRRPIHPLAAWDLGHDDHDRTKYRGPEHVSCNRGAGGRASGASRKNSGPEPRSREW
nr:AAA family ATPase [Nocardia wallacei]